MVRRKSQKIHNIKEDFHGWKLEEAKQAVEHIISSVRAEGGELVNAEFITGHGVIRDSLLELLKSYGLDANVSWANSGVINAIIE